MKTLLLAVIIGLVLIASAGATSLTGCGTLNMPGGYYTLVSNVDAAGSSCLVITGNNVSLNCGGNTVSNASVGVDADANGVTVANCDFQNDVIGINGEPAKGGFTFAGNTFEGNPSTIDINLDTTGTANITQNSFTGAGGGDAGTGIVLPSTTDPVIYVTANTFTNKVTTVSVDEHTFPALTLYFRNNIVTGGNFSFTGTVGANIFLSGNFINSTNYFSMAGGLFPINLNESVGNFWADPYGYGFSQRCVDANLDGVCDAAFTAYTGATDYLPLTTYAGGTPGLPHTPPVYKVAFMGVDTAVQNFIFRAWMTSTSNTTGFEAQLVDYQGGFTNMSSIVSEVNFNRVADLALVSNSYCPGKLNLTPGTPGSWFGSDGSLFINESTGCLWGTDITLPPIALSSVNGSIHLTSNVQFLPASGFERSFGLYSSANNFIGELIFIFNTGNTVNVTTENGTLLVTNGTLGSNNWFTVSADISASSVTWSVHNGAGSLLGSVTESVSGFSDVSVVAIDEIATADGSTSVDNIRFSATKQVTYPPYVFFDTLAANNPVPDWKELKVPIGNRTFGSYETYLWGTDSVLGLGYYAIPDYETFTYDANTPQLTDAQVADALNQLNVATGAGSVVSGDLATDWLPRLWNLIGLKTVGSKMIGGLALMILTIFFLSGFGEAVVIFVASVEAVVFAIPQVGLFPVWFIIIEVVIAAALIAVAIRKQTTG